MKIIFLICYFLVYLVLGLCWLFGLINFLLGFLKDSSDESGGLFKSWSVLGLQLYV